MSGGIERLDPSRVAGTSAEDVRRYIESDFKIRQGLCPNGCGLMHPCSYGQECAVCAFSTNALPEPVTAM